MSRRVPLFPQLFLQPYSAARVLTAAKQSLYVANSHVQVALLMTELKLRHNLPINSPPAMPTSDYISAGGGGLRLKGVDPSSKITKHKKKRPKPSSDPTTSVPKSKELQEPEHANPDPDMDKTPNENSSQLEDQDQDQDRRDGEEDPRGGKTEAEIRHEERRRRRVCLSHYTINHSEIGH